MEVRRLVADREEDTIEVVAPPALGTYAGRYTLLADRSAMGRGGAGTFRFKVLDGDGLTVRAFEAHGGGRMHLVVVRRRDLSHYRHLYPSMALDGTWWAPVDLPEAGIYRAIADFSAGGARHTLGTDLLAEGSAEATAVPEPATTASVDGYEVRMEGAPLAAGAARRVGFEISRGGRSVAGLDQHFGAPGHLIALRRSDLALFHGRPLDVADAGVPTLGFGLDLPVAGLYRLFLRFVHGGRERTVGFTVEVGR
jgi:hypothetical protein